MQKIGITEQGDAALDLKWRPWVLAGKPAILISKDPGLLYEYVKDLENVNLIIHCTITGNGGTIIEPNVPAYEESLQALVKFVNLFGPERVVLRIDPIIPLQDYIDNSKKVLDRAKELLGDNMCRVRISFYDNYKHTSARFEEIGITLPFKSFHLPMEFRQRMWEFYGKPELCGEENMPSTPCISEIDCKIFGVEPGERAGYQRSTCDCLTNKLELLKRTGTQCKHSCKYCYLQKDHKNTGLF
jgi:DNA repair photolyase